MKGKDRGKDKENWTEKLKTRREGQRESNSKKGNIKRGLNELKRIGG